MYVGLFEVLSSKYFSGIPNRFAPWGKTEGTHLVFVLGSTENNPNKKFFFGRIFCFTMSDVEWYNDEMLNKLLYV